MKKIIAMVLVLTLVLTSFVCVGAETVEKEKDSSAFEVIYIPYVTDEDYDWRTVIKARYTDTKEPITLSLVFDDRLYATVPKENAKREIEAFETEEIEFSDYDAKYYEFHSMKQLSRTGVIKGDENGRALPFDNITRAEACAMIMRFLGLNKIAMQGTVRIFDDVTSDKWYYREVLSAYNYGLVKGDSEKTFSPERNVTREEITVMAARGVKLAGLGYPGSENMNTKDDADISEWAKDAYAMMGNYVESDYDDSDPEYPHRILNPKKFATRYDVAYLLRNIEDHCQVYPSKIAEQFGFDKVMPVIDGSTSTYPFTEAVYGNLFSNGGLHPSKPEKHSKSHATYQKLINGEIDMMFASVYPASDILAMAKEKNVELELIPIAYDAMIFFTNKENSAEGLTTEQISNIYVNDAYDNWNELSGPDALLYPYCRNNDSGSHAQMEKHFLNGADIHPEVKKETSYTMSNVLTDVIAAKTDEPVGYGLGYSIYYYYHNVDMVLGTKQHLKLLAIDGVYPTDDTIADGSYPLSNNTYVVLRKDMPKDAPARKMAEFMLTEAGQMCVDAAGFGKLKPSVDDLVFSDKLNSQMPKDKNYMFSPLSVKMALSLLINGASGETKKEIANALGYEMYVNEAIDSLNTFSKDLIERYSKTENLKLNIANSVWLNESRTDQNFSTDYKNKVSEFYDAEIKAVSEKNAVKDINSWVSDKTNGKIPEIIKEANFAAMLVNAVYFKGAWQSEFAEDLTSAGEFTNADGKTAQIDFMNKTSWMNVYNAAMPDLKVVELPYKNRFDSFSDDGEYLGSESFEDLDVSMFLLMSARDINVEETLSELIRNENLSSAYTKLSVPKFKIEYSTTLKDIFKAMGIKKAFEKNAEFEKMFDAGNMFVSDAIHKTYIDVNEKGTEAAAVTSIVMATSALPPEPTIIKFDKPFYFVIRDNTSGETLFMGKYAFGK